MSNKKFKDNKLLIDYEKINADIDCNNSPLSFQSYKQFCSYLNIPLSSGKQKILQLEKLHNYLSYQKLPDNSFLISKAFFPIMEYNKKNLKELIEYSILVFILSQHSKDQSSFVTSISNMAKLIGCITEQYLYFYSHPKEFSYNTSIPLSTIQEFFDKTGDSYKYYLNQALIDLQKYNFIKFEKRFFGSEYHSFDDVVREIKSTPHGDQFVDFSSNISHSRRPLSDDEKSILISIERNTICSVLGFQESPSFSKADFLQSLKDKDITPISLIFKLKKQSDYFDLLNKSTFEALGLANISECYNISYNFDVLSSALQALYKSLSFKGISLSQQKELNKFFVSSSFSDKIKSNTLKRHLSEKNKIKNDISLSSRQQKSLIHSINNESNDFSYMLSLLMYCFIKNSKPCDVQMAEYKKLLSLKNNNNNNNCKL